MLHRAANSRANIGKQSCRFVEHLFDSVTLLPTALTRRSKDSTMNGGGGGRLGSAVQPKQKCNNFMKTRQTNGYFAPKQTNGSSPHPPSMKHATPRLFSPTRCQSLQSICTKRSRNCLEYRCYRKAAISSSCILFSIIPTGY